MRVYYNNVIQAPIGRKFFDKIAGIFYKTNSKTVSLALVGNNEIRKINRMYRNIDAPTDVLSFSEIDEKKNFPKDEITLGEIIISYPRAKKQARDHKQSVKAELCTLFVHGLAHLSGYVHNNNREAKRMEGLEKSILKEIRNETGIKISYD